MAVANEAPCSRLGYGVWSTPRTCIFFVISFSFSERLFFISMYTTESNCCNSFERSLSQQFHFFAEKGLKLEYPDPLMGNRKWLIDDKGSVKCVFGRDSVMVRSWSGKKSSRIAGVWISSSDHYLHWYSLKSRYDLGNNFPTVPQPE